jgi:mRNA interferase MazF
MTVSRGDVILVDFPFSAGGGSKVRPAVVVQNERNNRRLTIVIVAMITSHTGRARSEATQLLIEIATPDGRQTGLIMDSAVNCANLFTIHRSKVVQIVGNCSTTLQAGLDLCLKSALGLK